MRRRALDRVCFPCLQEAALRVIRSWGASQAGAWDLPHCPVPSRSDSGSGANLAEGADMTSPAGFSSPAARAVSAAVLLHLATRTTEREAAEMLITKLEADAGARWFLSAVAGLRARARLLPPSQPVMALALPPPMVTSRSHNHMQVADLWWS